ncbi:LacI family DNA-binding transcriptional regulator [Devosia beringensis]|uniref:LacI family DNA-binding transcriptional regulator n=1 Tax=Devosia beringensis TaxID=2657486 RepID=UPI00186BA165|nr:LacI family DNA-binding transcriptional regulator [Devosia beringensis]
MKKRVKMVDVARAANVSRTAVSLILNQVPGMRIAEVTRQRVLQVARELGYDPGPRLDALGQAPRRLYGVLINEISSAYPIDLIYGLQGWANAQGLQVIIQVSDGTLDRELAALDNFSRFGVEGVVYASSFSAIATPPEALNAFRHVLLNCRREDSSGLAVLPAERHGGAVAAQHLLDIGCRRIATITGEPWQFASKERLAGYHRTLNKAGLNLGKAYERTSDWGHASGYDAARELFALAEPPDAIFGQNDIIVRGVMAAAREAGLRVPDDLAVIGYDDREFAKDLEISTVTLPYAEMAERALGELASDRALGDKTLFVAGELITRATTRRLNVG